MPYIKTKAVDKIVQMKKRIRIIQGGSCFVAGTPVYLEGGYSLPIEDIQKGYRVLSLSSNREILVSEVYDLWENAPNKPLISFQVGDETIRATYDHKFYTPEGYKELYRIVWGSLDSSQRLQLELLCKQHGATFDPYSSRRENASDNETSDNHKEQPSEAIPNTEDSSGQEDHLRSSGSSESLDTKSTEPEADRPHQRKQFGQSGGKSGMGISGREYAPSLRDGANGEEAWGTEREIKTEGQTGDRDTGSLERTTPLQSEGISTEVWGIGSLYQGYSGEPNLLPFTPKHIQIQEPEKTFAISVREENYFVGDNRINVSNSAGKTIALLLILIDRALSEKGKLFSVVSETLPHLKKGAIRDFLNIMEAHGYYNDNNWNRTDYIYTFETGTKLEFFSADSPDKVRGPRRDVLFINEANNISYETYTQLAIRTNEHIYIDYNPVSEFWAHDEIINNLDKDTLLPVVDHDFIILTYKDNDALPEAVVQELESRKNRVEWWKVYGEGQLGGAEGMVYEKWQQIDAIPEGARLERFGLDFGYTNDPTALIALYYYDQGYIVDEILYQKGLSNKQIADVILNQPKQAMVIADSAEPKSIDEIRSYGINIQPAVKGQGSINQGIALTQAEHIRVTKRSVNIIKENRNYLWEKDQDDKPTGSPIAIWNHSMDAIRYAMTSVAVLIKRQEFLKQMPARQYKPRINPAR